MSNQNPVSVGGKPARPLGPADRNEAAHHERDDDGEQVPPPWRLVAVFLLPVLLLIVWAISQA